MRVKRVSKKLKLSKFNPYTGCFLHWASPKKLKYVKLRLGESTLTKIVLDTPNLDKINLSVLSV